MTITLYGIRNCDTVKKARKWLETHAVEYRFHDLRDDGLTTELLSSWTDQLGWETLLNKRSTTWRQLSDQDKDIHDATQATALLLAHPTLVKRPVLAHANGVLVGFSASSYATALQP